MRTQSGTAVSQGKARSASSRAMGRGKDEMVSTPRKAKKAVATVVAKKKMAGKKNSGAAVKASAASAKTKVMGRKGAVKPGTAKTGTGASGRVRSAILH